MKLLTKNLILIFVFLSSFLVVKSEIKKDINNDLIKLQSSLTVYDVREYGAIGDGKTDDTRAVQKAIDVCSKDHGGMVLVNNGTFLIDGITIKSNVELHLTASATLLGSLNYKRYPQDKKFNFKTNLRSLVYAEDCQNIAITGTGTINGQGNMIKAGSGFDRPNLIIMHDCKGIRIKNVFLTNSNFFGVFLLNSEKIRINGVNLVNLQCENNDGFDIDGCRDVFISNCYINTMDDCLAFKSSSKQTPSSGIVVSNCILTSRCAAIRFGPDALGNIENVVVTNCVIRNTGLNGIKIQECLGAVMRNMTFSNIIMSNVKGPISIRLAGWSEGAYVGSWTDFDDNGWEDGKLQNILFNNIQATVPSIMLPDSEFKEVLPGTLNITKLNLGISITGTSVTRPRQITFSNIDITFAGGGTSAQGARRNIPDLDRNYPTMCMFGELPAYGLYMHHVSGVVLNNVEFHLEKEDLRPAIVCDDVDDLELSGFKAEGSKKAESLIRLENTQNVFINSSRTLNGIGLFLKLEGSQTIGIKLTGNNLNLATKVIEENPEVSPNAFSFD